jgi:hypothetical protein
MIDPLTEEARPPSGGEAGDDDGLFIESLASGTTLTMQTVHSPYRIVVLDGPRHLARIRGGTMFPEETVVSIEGATGCGSAVRVGWIIVGLYLELRLGSLRIRSSEVCSVSIVNLP